MTESLDKLEYGIKVVALLYNTLTFTTKGNCVEVTFLTSPEFSQFKYEDGSSKFTSRWQSADQEIEKNH